MASVQARLEDARLTACQPNPSRHINANVDWVCSLRSAEAEGSDSRMGSSARDPRPYAAA